MGQQACFFLFWVERQLVPHLWSFTVRGSPLAVIMGVVDSRTANTTPRLASTLPSDMPFSGGSYQSREELKSWPVV
jgi:hypothetical protein